MRSYQLGEAYCFPPIFAYKTIPSPGVAFTTYLKLLLNTLLTGCVLLCILDKRMEWYFMNRTKLPFEKEVISSEEMKAHIDWYVSTLLKAESQKDNKEKAAIYRTVREALKEESRHYEKVKIKEFYMNQSSESLAYCETILEISRNSGFLNRTISEVIFDMLSDFKYYQKMYIFD